MNEDDRLREAFMDMLNQACGKYTEPEWRYDKLIKPREFKGYDSQCLSAYECALDLAVDFGWIKKEEILR